MAKTTSDLATAVLRRLRVIGRTETPEAEDQAAVTSLYADTYQELEYRDLAFWDEDEIDERVFPALTDLMAGRLAPDFGKEAADLEATGMQRIRVLAAETPTGSIVTGSYF